MQTYRTIHEFVKRFENHSNLTPTPVLFRQNYQLAGHGLLMILTIELIDAGIVYLECYSPFRPGASSESTEYG
jgi:hypothetical protein